MTRGIGLYVHIPFCAARCPYCDFATAPATSALRGRYLEALGTEIRREGRLLGRPRVRTLYVGGGTPSLLEPGEVYGLGAALREAFELRPREVSIEANPATLGSGGMGPSGRSPRFARGGPYPRLAHRVPWERSDERSDGLAAWLALGLTRISVGAQSFSPRGLRALGRAHQPEDIPAAVALARSAGLAVNLDLIFGWPEQTRDEWTGDLDAALALAPDHLSAYPLELALEPEEGIANWPGGGWRTLERWRRSAAERQPAQDEIALFYAIAERRLAQAGYRHYEIANWARPGRRSLHNLTYWRGGSWLGVGVGAHSHLAGHRSRNPGGLLAYIERIEATRGRISDDGSVPAAEAAMLALRLDGGLDLRRHAARFGAPAAAAALSALRSLDGRALLRWSGERVRLTPRGRILANEVFMSLLPE